MEEQVQQEMEEMRKQPSRLEGPEGAPLSGVIGAVLTIGVLGFSFGIGATLGSKMASHRARGPYGTHG